MDFSRATLLEDDLAEFVEKVDDIYGATDFSEVNNLYSLMRVALNNRIRRNLWC